MNDQTDRFLREWQEGVDAYMPPDPEVEQIAAILKAEEHYGLDYDYQRMSIAASLHRAGVRPVPPEPEFDLEDYRADLKRRIAELNKLERQYHTYWVQSGLERNFQDAQRNMYKAQGLEIALGLLPKETP